MTAMKLLVTGGAGFIGSAVVRRAVRRGWEVVNVDCLAYAANLDNLRDVDKDPGYHFVKADIRDAAAMRQVLHDTRPDAVMHLAAESHVDRSIDRPRAFIDTNILGTYTLLCEVRDYVATLDRAARGGFRFHHISTDEVYGSLGSDGTFSEETAYAPNSPYAASKASADFLVRAWGKTYDLPVVTTNCSNNYGPYQFPEKLIPLVILSAGAGKPIPVYGEGKNVRDWLHVDDHAEALLLVVDRGRLGETYAIGSDNEWRNIDLVRSICDIMDDLAPRKNGSHADLIKFVADRPGHDLRYAVNAGKIRDELGWAPAISMEQGLRDTVRWYLDNEWWWRAIRDRGFDEATRLGTAGT